MPSDVSAAAGLPIDSCVIPAESECGPRFFAEPQLQIALSGFGRRWLDIGPRKLHLGTRPGMIELYGKGYEISQTRWSGQPGNCISISLPCAVTDRLLGDDAPPFRLATAHELFDPRIARLGFELSEEVRQCRPNGPLYAEGLSLALIALLSRKESGRDVKAAGLSHAQQQCIRDLIEGNLAGDLSVERLSALINMSPFQLSRRFKTSFGVSPHRYVVQRRLETATRELRADRDRSIADIAVATGFSSQSHLTEALRRHTGETPARARWS